MKRLTLVLVMVTLLVVSCAPKSVFTPYKTDYIKKVILPEDVIVMEGEPDKPYIEIGFVEIKKRASTAFGDVTSADMIPILQEEASLAGGEAVINVKFERYFERSISMEKTIPAMMATGTVVVFE